MKNALLFCSTLLLAVPAFAEEPPAGAMDMSKMGPWSRKPTNEKQTKKEITDFIKAADEQAKKGDFQAALGQVDFPVYMMTDDAKGAIEAAPWSQDKYTEMMKPFWETMPKDTKTTHKPTIVVLSDNMAALTDDFTMTMGKQKMSGRNSGLLVKIGTQWKWKVMAEAGWGGMPAPQAKAETKPAPAPAASAKK
jgi:hypothetical protein